MDFSYTDEQETFRHELRAWLEENAPEGWLEDPELPDDDAERVEFLRDWQRTLADDGWAGVHWPEEYGGRGASLVEQTIYREEMARINAPPQINLIGINLIAPTLIEVGTEAQKQRFLPKILSAEEIWCQGYSEPEAGSDVASLTTNAEANGDGEWLVNGQKIWTSYAHVADWCFLVTRTDDSGKKHEGLTVFLVEMDQDGISTEPIHQPHDDRTFNQVYFDDAVASADLVVGEIDRGWDVVMTLSAFEHGSTSIYSIEQRYLALLEYCRTETRNGTPLVERDRIRQQLADFDARIQAAKATHYRNVSKQAESGTPGPEGSMDLLISDELRHDLLNFAVNVQGPAAALWENGHNAFDETSGYIRSYGAWIAAGTGDIQRNIIGERVLGLPKDNKSKTSHRSE
ncbi:acyl-CoA dehydrogenase family protein [Natronorubrum daqingense]|uniref:Acyl-CoA dehydrogenase n=1 Tax=Natronorubrum daqingense TaxID=588898 RepID=A0A1N7D526_9EURY|nr:acyl-CoA dehydrogenase family protein [Natronorubrum daqingense]APX97209.1 acyl-CoA dehydrogenase [Natronorubrum daqingense]SIR70795.1 Acyl-CoA dehydrogenase [Natronorubrum daqingense]